MKPLCTGTLDCHLWILGCKVLPHQRNAASVWQPASEKVHSLCSLPIPSACSLLSPIHSNSFLLWASPKHQVMINSEWSISTWVHSVAHTQFPPPPLPNTHAQIKSDYWHGKNVSSFDFKYMWQKLPKPHLNIYLKNVNLIWAQERMQCWLFCNFYTRSMDQLTMPLLFIS